MPTVSLAGSTLSVRPSRVEKVLGLLRDLEVPLADVRCAEAVPHPLWAARGIRAPGLGLPGLALIGTWRWPGERSWVCVRRGQSGLRIRLVGQRYDTVLVGADDAAALAAAIGALAPLEPVERDLVIAGPVPLAATLTLPSTATGPVPAVLLVCGSGPLDRDGNHKRARFDVSRQLARALADAGLASLRYDKRGVGATPGDWWSASLSDNADDVTAALRGLAARPEVDPARLVLVGHSEGAILSAAVAARGVAELAGVVLLAGSARPGADLLRWQARVIAPTLPRPVRALLRLFRVDLERKVAANQDRVRRTTGDVARIGGARVNARWTREFLDHDPRADLARVGAPVLAITGGKDLQVDPADLDVIAATVPGEVETARPADLTHTLRSQPGPASLRAYRAELRRPVDPGVVEQVVGFCRRTTGPEDPRPTPR